MVCSSKLLSKATMILFLNKCDLLKRKLKSGVQIKTYLPSFGERSNDVGTVVKCTSSSIISSLLESSLTVCRFDRLEREIQRGVEGAFAWTTIKLFLCHFGRCMLLLSQSLRSHGSFIYLFLGYQIHSCDDQSWYAPLLSPLLA